MSKSYVGAVVKYCGHDAVFFADIYSIEGVNVVRASGPVNDKTLLRGKRNLAPTHELTDFPSAGFWRPDLGVFVVPHAQVTEIEKETTT